jgi:hypothetical protein
MLWDLSGDITTGTESLTSAAYRSWYGGETVEQISAASDLKVDVVIGGNGLMDSFVDFVYVPPELPPSEGEAGSNSGLDGSSDSSTQGPKEGEIFTIKWSWGSNLILDFDPQTDKLDFGWMGGDAFTLSEKNGSLVIGIESNQQSITLKDVLATELSMQNIQTLDMSATIEWGAFLG